MATLLVPRQAPKGFPSKSISCDRPESLISLRRSEPNKDRMAVGGQSLPWDWRWKRVDDERQQRSNVRNYMCLSGLHGCPPTLSHPFHLLRGEKAGPMRDPLATIIRSQTESKTKTRLAGPGLPSFLPLCWFEHHFGAHQFGMKGRFTLHHPDSALTFENQNLFYPAVVSRGVYLYVDWIRLRGSRCSPRPQPTCWDPETLTDRVVYEFIIALLLRLKT